MGFLFFFADLKKNNKKTYSIYIGNNKLQKYMQSLQALHKNRI